MSILPPQEKDGEIKFAVAKGLPYRPRMALVALLLLAGVTLQVFLNFWPGFALLFGGLLLGMNSGYDAAPKTSGKEEWSKVTPDEYAKVRAKAEELSRWDEDFFDITSVTGLIGLVCIALLCAAVYAFAAGTWRFPDGTWGYFGADAALVIFSLWLVGTRSYLKKDKLIIKVGLLEEIMAGLRGPSDVQVQPLLALLSTEGGRTEPEDARLMVKLVGAPADFMGLQVQVSINSVQGKDYPYLYCVLLAKAGSGLLDGWEGLAKQPERSVFGGLLGALLGTGSGGITYEFDRSGEVELVVVRQETTRKTGYYTAPPAAQQVVNSALDLARALTARKGT